MLSISIAATAGRVALCNNTTLLTSAAFTGANPSGSTIIDFVGFGSTTLSYEGTAPAPATSNNTTSILRNSGGSTDTNNNSVDFSTGTPMPRNTVTSTFNPSYRTFKAIVSGGKLIVTNVADGSNVDVYSMLGAKVQSDKLVAGSIQLNNLAKGLYIVQVGKETVKIKL